VCQRQYGDAKGARAASLKTKAGFKHIFALFAATARAAHAPANAVDPRLAGINAAPVNQKGFDATKHYGFERPLID
jgi:hypothetical protein